MHVMCPSPPPHRVGGGSKRPIPLMYFVERPADDVAHWLRPVYVGNVGTAFAMRIFALSAQPAEFALLDAVCAICLAIGVRAGAGREFPVVHRAAVRAVFAEGHRHTLIVLSQSANVPSKYFSGTMSSRYLKHGQQTTRPASFGSPQPRQIVSVRTCSSRSFIQLLVNLIIAARCRLQRRSRRQSRARCRIGRCRCAS